MNRRNFTLRLAQAMTLIVGITGGGLTLATDKYPDRPISIHVGFPPGGSTDIAMRVIAKDAAERLGQPIIIENRPGAGGTISLQRVLRAEPDGYNLTLSTLTIFRAPVSQGATYDPINDLTYIVNLANLPFGIVVRSDSPFNSWEELLKFGQENPDKINYGVPAGLGNSAHLIMRAMNEQDKLNWNPIPYKGSADTVQALLAGDITFAVDASGGFAPLVESGRAKLLALADSQRSDQWPDAPTTKELGYEARADSPWGLVGPAGMDQAIVARLQDAFKESIADPEVIAGLRNLGQSPRYMSAKDYTDYAKEAVVYQQDLLRRYGFEHKSQKN